MNNEILLPSHPPKSGFFREVLRNREDVFIVLPPGSKSTIMGYKEDFILDIDGLYCVSYDDESDNYTVCRNLDRAAYRIKYIHGMANKLFMTEYSLDYKSPHYIPPCISPEPCNIFKTIHTWWVMFCLGDFFNILFRGGLIYARKSN